MTSCHTDCYEIVCNHWSGLDYWTTRLDSKIKIAWGCYLPGPKMNTMGV